MNDPCQKPFRLTAEQILVLAPGHGSCIASGRITCEERKVGYMYREEPDNKIDSGWRFLSGDESDSYINNPDHLGIYDVNTIANYDPDIIPLLNSPVGAAFMRAGGKGAFVRVKLHR